MIVKIINTLFNRLREIDRLELVLCQISEVPGKTPSGNEIRDSRMVPAVSR